MTHNYDSDAEMTGAHHRPGWRRLDWGNALL